MENWEERRAGLRRLYKNPRGRTLSWKEVYRKRCMERLRSSRSQLVERFRAAGDALNNNNNSRFTGLVQDVMEVEWAALTHSNAFTPLRDGEEEAEKKAAIEEIQQELLSEEERLLVEVCNYDAAALASKVQWQQMDEVICPVCQVKGLHESGSEASGGGGVVACDCGLALHGANITLNTVRSSLENTVGQHSQMCGGRMSFTTTSDSHTSNVLVTCAVCDWMSFLL